MSAINSALSKLAEQQGKANSLVDPTLVRAKIEPVRSPRLMWAFLGGFTLSLGVGAWAVTGSPPSIQTSLIQRNNMDEMVLPATNLGGNSNALSNTSKVINKSLTPIYVNEPVIAQVAVPSKVEVVPVHSSSTQDMPSSSVRVAIASTPSSIKSTDDIAKPPVTTKFIAATKIETKPSNQTSSMQIQEVELTHQQMADKAIDRAEKALDANDFEEAAQEYQNALRYVPEDEVSRRKLAALYYSNTNVRKSAETLEEGIRLDKNSNELRIALASIFLKEKQPAAALNTLGYIPNNVSNKYLAMRAALAQQLKSDDLALQSYQMLIKRDAENGRWWLGLGIQQERALDLQGAKESYTKALTMVGLSSQSQSFMRKRLAVLNNLEQGDK
ncbi:MAG: tetratricopeptide repeat protein [Vibrio hibernica]